MKLKDVWLLGRQVMTNLDSILKSRDRDNKSLYSQSYGFSNSQVRMGELNHKEGWAPKNWCFRTVMLEKTLETPLHCNEIKPVHPKGNQPWICIGRTDTEAETPILRPLSHQGSPILWLPDTKSRPTGKGPDAGKDWRPKEKGATEDEMAGWHHQLNGHEFEQALGVGDGQANLVCCSPWVAKSQTQPRD